MNSSEDLCIFINLFILTRSCIYSLQLIIISIIIAKENGSHYNTHIHALQMTSLMQECLCCRYSHLVLLLSLVAPAWGGFTLNMQYKEQERIENSCSATMWIKMRLNPR